MNSTTRKVYHFDKNERWHECIYTEEGLYINHRFPHRGCYINFYPSSKEVVFGLIQERTKLQTPSSEENSIKILENWKIYLL